MKTVVSLLIIFFSLTIFAGDINTVCYQNGDMGDYFEISDPLNNQHQVTMSFDFNKKTYIISTKVNTLFNYNVKATIIDNLSGESVIKAYENIDYADEITISPLITCTVVD